MGVLMLSLQGCPGTIDDPQAFLDARNMTDAGRQDTSTPDATTGCNILELFTNATTGCAGASCHAGGGVTAPSLEMDDWGNLGATSLFCKDTPYVTPGEPNASALYLKLLPDGERAPCVGDRMPSTRPALSPNEIECVRAWIEGM